MHSQAIARQRVPPVGYKCQWTFKRSAGLITDKRIKCTSKQCLGQSYMLQSYRVTDKAISQNVRLLGPSNASVRTSHITPLMICRKSASMGDRLGGTYKKYSHRIT